MRGKILAAVLSVSAFMSCFTPVAYMAEVGVNLNGTPLEFDVKPFIENDRTLVPMRKIFEAVGATVEWDEDTRTAIVSRVKNDKTVFIAIQADGEKAFVDSTEKQLDVPAKIVDDRMFVPLRFVIEALGEKVEWNEQTYTVEITME